MRCAVKTEGRATRIRAVARRHLFPSFFIFFFLLFLFSFLFFSFLIFVIFILSLVTYVVRSVLFLLEGPRRILSPLFLFSFLFFTLLLSQNFSRRKTPSHVRGFSMPKRKLRSRARRSRTEGCYRPALSSDPSLHPSPFSSCRTPIERTTSLSHLLPSSLSLSLFLPVYVLLSSFNITTTSLLYPSRHISLSFSSPFPHFHSVLFHLRLPHRASMISADRSAPIDSRDDISN